MGSDDGEPEADASKENTGQRQSPFTARSVLIMFGVGLMFMVARTSTGFFVAACVTAVCYSIDRVIRYCIDRGIQRKRQQHGHDE